MPLTKENLQQLIALQDQDAVLDRLQSEMDKLPPFIAAVRARLEKEKSVMTELKGSAVALEKKKKEKELELAQKEEAVKKHSLELNQVKTNEAFKALQSEIEKAKQEGGQLETDILEIMEDLDRVRREEKSLVARLKETEGKANAEIAVHEGKLKELQGQHEAAKSQREQGVAPIPADVMRVYNHIRSRGKKNAIVKIEGELCGACRITLTPQIIVEATKAKSLVLCESCQRIIYRDALAKAEAPAKQPI